MLALSRRFSAVKLEGDSLMVIQAIHSQVVPTEIQRVIFDMNQLASWFNLVAFSHVKSTGNQVAHALAPSFYITFPSLVIALLSRHLYSPCSAGICIRLNAIQSSNKRRKELCFLIRGGFGGNKRAFSRIEGDFTCTVEVQ